MGWIKLIKSGSSAELSNLVVDNAVTASNYTGDVSNTSGYLYSNLVNMPLLLSSSAQISSNISGAFESVSASFANSISGLSGGIYGGSGTVNSSSVITIDSNNFTGAGFVFNTAPNLDNFYAFGMSASYDYNSTHTDIGVGIYYEDPATANPYMYKKYGTDHWFLYPYEILSRRNNANASFRFYADYLIYSNNTGSTTGIRYGGDYSANYVARSLVDKGYVDSITGSLSGGDGIYGGSGAVNSSSIVTINHSGMASASINFNNAPNTDAYPAFGFSATGNGKEAAIGISYEDPTVFTPYMYYLDSFSYWYIHPGVIGGGASGTSYSFSPTKLGILYSNTATASSGIRYGSDFSSNYTARSLVDKGYVDSITGSLSGGDGIYGGSGAISSSTVVGLYDISSLKLRSNKGGTQTENLILENVGTMSGGGNASLVIRDNPGEVISRSTKYSAAGISTTYVNYDKYTIRANGSSDGPSNRYVILEWDASDGIKFEDNRTLLSSYATKGIYYAADYSSTFVARSLVDKGYVDSITGSISSPPGGTNQSIQFNDSGVFSGSSDFTFNKLTNNLYVTGSVNISGTLTAAVKSFDIPHPTIENARLVYGSLEGPEFGVYYRGKLTGGKIIELPEEWAGLVDIDTVTVQLTPHKKYQRLFVENITENTVAIDIDSDIEENINCFFIVHGERKDVSKLITIQ